MPVNRILATLRSLVPEGRIARSVLLLGGSTAMAQLIGMAAMPLVTRLYTPAEIGTVSLFLSFFLLWANSLSLRYEYALLIARDDAESHVLLRLGTLLVLIMSVLGLPLLWALRHFRILEFDRLPAATFLFVLPIFAGHGLFMLHRAWALRGGLFKDITQTSIARAAANAGTKVALGLVGGGILGLLTAELAGACLAMARLMRAARRHFAASRPENIACAQLAAAAAKYRKSALLETPSTWINALALTLPLPLVAELYGVPAAGWFGLARLVVGAPNGQLGAAVADVFQRELARAMAAGDHARARSLFYKLLRNLALVGLVPLIVVITLSPSVFPLVFGAAWSEAGPVAACLAPWLYAAFIVSPLSRALSVLQAQEWKLAYDLSAVGLLLAAFSIAVTCGLSLTGFCLLLSTANILGYTVYGLVLVRTIAKQGRPGPPCGPTTGDGAEDRLK